MNVVCDAAEAKMGGCVSWLYSSNRIMLVAVLLLVLLCHVVGQKHSINCSIQDDPLPIPHEFYHPGDLVIGEIVSQVFFLHNLLSFLKQPTQIVINEPM